MAPPEESRTGSPPLVAGDPERLDLRGRLKDGLRLTGLTLRYAGKGMNDDNIFFLAGGIAFSILLAIVPFVLLVVAGLTLVLGLSPEASASGVRDLLDRLLPATSAAARAPLHGLIDEAVRTRGALGLAGALTYLWFSARLFGSLRTVLVTVFDRGRDRGILMGKWFDLRLTVYSTVVLAAYVTLSLYLAVARSQRVGQALGLRGDVMGLLEYALGRLVAFAFVVALFYALYHFLPKRRVRWQQALFAATSAGLLFEVARNVWTALTKSFDPGSLYSGTLYALVSLVFWVYYAALIFILAGELSQGHELARAVKPASGDTGGPDGPGSPDPAGSDNA